MNRTYQTWCLIVSGVLLIPALGIWLVSGGNTPSQPVVTHETPKIKSEPSGSGGTTPLQSVVSSEKPQLKADPPELKERSSDKNKQPVSLLRSARVVPSAILEPIPLPPLVLLDDKQLSELRIRLLAEADERRRRMSQQGNPGRATYGGVAPLALLPQAVAEIPKNGELGIYKPEIERLDGLIAKKQAGFKEYFLRGQICFDVGRYREAVLDFDKAVTSTNNPPVEGLAMRGVASLLAGDPTAARSDLDLAVAQQPNVRNLNNRGAALLALGKGRDAIKDFDRAISERQFLVKTSLVVLNRARAASDVGDDADALARLKQFLGGAQDPSAIVTANYLQAMVHARKGEYAASGRCYDHVIELRRAETAMTRGLTSGSAVAALPTDHTLLDELIGPETAAEALVGRGIAHHQLGQSGPAIRDYSQAIRIRPRLVQAYVNRAVSYTAQGDEDLAEKDLDDAISLDPNNAAAHYNRGWLRLLQGRDAEAEPELKRAGELAAILVPKAKKLQEDVRHARETITTAPPAPVVVKYRAATPEEAIEWLKRARVAGDNEGVLLALADPLGPLFRKLYAATERADQAHRRYMEIRNRQAGSFAEPDKWPITLQENKLKELQQQQKFIVSSMTILSKEPVDPQSRALNLRVRTIKANALNERQTPIEEFIAIRQGDDWKLLPRSSAELTPAAQKLIANYFEQQTRRIEQIHRIIDEATRLRLAGKPVNDLQIALALTQVYSDYPLPGKTGLEDKGLGQTMAEIGLMMSPYGQGLQQLYLYNRATQQAAPRR